MANESMKPVVLDALKNAGDEGMDLKELVEVTGVGNSTVRRHLKGLIEDGVVKSFRLHQGGRGRPSHVYVVR